MNLGPASGALLAALALTGCAQAVAGLTPAAPSTARSAGAGGAGGLPVSHASAHRVQPQPAAGSCRARGRGLYELPDPRCTPGAINPAVTQADLARTICHPGYSEHVRPPESVTEAEKRASLAAYGDRRPLHDYEYDHLVSLELGGAPNDPRNLWPEPGASPNPKDALENRLHARVCGGATSLNAAQRAIARDWVSARRRYG
jgi:hypothetical protein